GSDHTRSKKKEQYDAQLKSEVLSYRAMPMLGAKENPLLWWETTGKSLPLLRDLATRVLCVPASSASSERLFSKAGLVSTNLRNRLKGAK
ncbi:unnamed protein product, partial [Laminaria digitata]